MKVVIIGTGNVATVLGKLLRGAGYSIDQVFGRNWSDAANLAAELGANPCNSWANLIRDADFYLAAISDEALYSLDQHLRLTDQLIVHTAGSVSKNVLKKISENYGVLYPLQSLRKEMAAARIPLLVDAVNELAMSRIVEVAERLSPVVRRTGDEERLKLHIAAVVVNNFTNHLYAVAADYCLQENISFGLLLPLISETAERLNLLSPQSAMTGPAIRKDTVTIRRHLAHLDTYPGLQKLYKQLTESIQEFAGDDA